MKIESLIKRKNGTRVTLDAPTRHYHFKPTEDDQRHLAEVTEASHIAMLLRIRDGYRAVEGEELPEDDNDSGKKLGERVLVGSNVHNATYIIKGGDEITLGDLVNMAFEDSGLSEDEWNDLADQERYEFIDTTLAELQGLPDEDAPAPVQENTSESDSGKQKDETPPPAPENTSDTAEADEAADKELTRDEWVEKYKALYGRNPAKSLTVAQIKRAVVEA